MIAFAFAAGIFAAVLLPWSGWYLWAALVLALAGLAALLGRKKWRFGVHLAVLLLSAAASLAYFTAYDALVYRPVREWCAGEQPRYFTGVVADYPLQTAQGYRVTIWLDGPAKAVYYGTGNLSSVEPGQRISGMARWRDASEISEAGRTTFLSRGVYVLLYPAGLATAEPEKEGSVWFLPQRSARAIKERIDAVWSGDPTAAAFLRAELTGDRSLISEEDSAAMSEAGLAHLFAVSGLHCAFLVTLLGLLIPPHRRGIYAAATSAVLLFYMVLVGLSPSVVRACVMQIFLLVAPLFKRNSDSLTSLGAALLVLLLANPYAAGGISLQLSFAATLGLLLLSGRLYAFLSGLYKGSRRLAKRLVSFLAANVSATLAALVFTIPLTAYYFNILTLISPLSNLLAVPVAGVNFAAGLTTVLLGFLWLPGAQILGWICRGLVHFVLAVAWALMRLPGHALYFSNEYLVYWLVCVYVMLVICLLKKGNLRKYALFAALSALTLALAIGLYRGQLRSGVMNAIALDVGQGECVLLYSDREAVVVDCGSSNSYVHAGDIAADRLGSLGFHKLKAVVLTHYHADHTNGVYELLARVPTKELWLPDIEDEYGVRERLINLASRLGTKVFFIREMERTPLGRAELTVFPPVGKGDMNEQGLTILCSADNFDVLITGDMAGSTEKQLIKLYDLPITEVLLVSHHGSRYSSSQAFLEEIRPEMAIISVGDNSYGHPTEEAMDRLRQSGAVIFRTDLMGDILVKARGGDG